MASGCDYSREAIILNISVKGGAINQRTATIRGNTVFENRGRLVY